MEFIDKSVLINLLCPCETGISVGFSFAAVLKLFDIRSGGELSQRADVSEVCAESEILSGIVST